MDTHSYWLAAALGFVQGLTEFLPVSSSAHLIVVSWLLEGKPLPLALNIALHMGTLLAVLLYFWRDWLGLARASLRRVLAGERSFEADTLVPALIIGSVPAAILGLSAQDRIEALFHNPLTVTFPLFAVGFILWWADKHFTAQRPFSSLTIRDGLLIGLAQAVALIPGVSRSGATITAGRSLGIKREDAARFSFLLGTPAMGGAALLHARDIAESIGHPVFYAGILVSCLVGCLAIGFFLAFIRRFGFLSFAIYRALLALVIGWVIFSRGQV